MNEINCITKVEIWDLHSSKMHNYQNETDQGIQKYHNDKHNNTKCYELLTFHQSLPHDHCFSATLEIYKVRMIRWSEVT